MTNNNTVQQRKSRPIPNCITTMKSEIGEHLPGQSLTMSFPVQDIFLNGNGVMQGGFTAAAFDNAFGVLLHLENKTVNMATIDLHVNYHRPIFANDRLIITAYLKALGSTIAALNAEAFNNEGKLVATATTNIMIIQR